MGMVLAFDKLKTNEKRNKILPVLEKGRQTLPASGEAMVDACLSDAQK